MEKICFGHHKNEYGVKFLKLISNLLSLSPKTKECSVAQVTTHAPQFELRILNIPNEEI